MIEVRCCHTAPPPTNRRQARAARHALHAGAGVDGYSDSVVVSVPKGADGAATKAFVKKARAMGDTVLGDTVRIKRVAAAPRLTLGPGEAILTGGSLQSGSTAVGITSGGTTGSCGANFQSFFQPLDVVLQGQGLTLK